MAEQLYANFKIHAMGITTEGIALHKGTKQGAIESPDCFNTAISEVLEEVLQKWEAEGKGVDMEDNEERIQLLSYADNLFPMAKSIDELMQKIVDLVEALDGREGIKTKERKNPYNTMPKCDSKGAHWYQNVANMTEVPIL